MQVDDLDRERVSGLRSFDRDRACERVDAIPVELGDRIGRRLRRDLVVADVAGMDDHRVAARNCQHRFVLHVPGEVHLVRREVVDPALHSGGREDTALRHDFSSLAASWRSYTRWPDAAIGSAR
jgi:hypothetical protein